MNRRNRTTYSFALLLLALGFAATMVFVDDLWGEIVFGGGALVLMALSIVVMEMPVEPRRRFAHHVPVTPARPSGYRCVVCHNRTAEPYRKAWMSCSDGVSMNQALCRSCWDGVSMWFQGSQTRKLFGLTMAHLSDGRATVVWYHITDTNDAELFFTRMEGY